MGSIRNTLLVVLLLALILAVAPSAISGIGQVVSKNASTARAEDMTITIGDDGFSTTALTMDSGFILTIKNLTSHDVKIQGGVDLTLGSGQTTTKVIRQATDFFLPDVAAGKGPNATLRVSLNVSAPNPTSTPMPVPTVTALPLRVVSNCPTTGEVKNMIRLDIVREATEVPGCAFEWRGIPNTADATVPAGVIATLHLADNNRIVVVDGDQPGNTRDLKSGTSNVYVIKAGTFRVKAGYPAGDAVFAPCALFQKEANFGAGESPDFPVQESNFSCPGLQRPQPSSGGSSVTACSQKNPNGFLRGGSWKFAGGNEWDLLPGQTVTIQGAAGWVVHTPQHPGDPGLPIGQSETLSAATAYCVNPR